MSPQVPGSTQVVELIRKELRAEQRAGEVLLVTVPFGAVALLVVALAVGADVPLLRRVGAGTYWAVVLLFGTLVATRHTAGAHPAQRDLLALLGVDPLAPLLARTAASTLLILTFQVILAPVAIALFDPPLHGWAWLALVAPLVAVGLGALGTLAGALASAAGGRAALVPLVVVPLAVPLLLAATQTLEATVHGESPVSWMLLAATGVLVALIALVLAARPLEGAAR